VHLSRREQPSDVLAVSLRPGTPLLPRCELLKKEIRIVALFLSVDPTEAERDIERFGIADGPVRRSGFGDP
jgi:hypothetical protein